MEGAGEWVGLEQREAGHQLPTAERTDRCAGSLGSSSTSVDI